MRKRYSSLQEFLDQTGRTQAEFGQRIGRSQPFVSRVLSGKQPLRLDEALTISRITGIPVERLVASQRRERVA